MSKSLLTAFMLIGSLGLAHADPDPAPAPAASDADRAAKLYAEGKRHFDIGEYAPAIASWKEAYLLSSASLLLFNIGQAYRLSNNCAEANRFYLNYRRVEPHPKNQDELDQAMAKCAGVEPATGDPSAPTGPTAPVTPPPVTPTTGTADANPTTTTPPAQPTPTPAPPSPAPPPEEHGGTLRTVGIVSGTVGVLVLLGSGAYALKAHSDANDVGGSAPGTSYTSVENEDKNGQTFANRAKLGLGVGAVLVAAGATMWIIGHREDEPHVGLAIVPGQTEVSFSCAF